MPLVQAKCPNCNGVISVDPSKEAAVCQSCGSPFIVEKAINQYNINNNIRADVVNVYSDKSIEFEISGGVLKSYKGESLTPTIPDGVVVIVGGVFRETMITRVTLPNTIRELRSELTDWCAEIGPFFNCLYLESINLPEGLRTIAGGSFHRCESLKEVIIPKSVDQQFGKEAFWGCKSLETVVFENNPLDVLWENCLAFENCTKLHTILYRYNGDLINPLHDYGALIASPFSDWNIVAGSFGNTPFYKSYWDLRCSAENRCKKCGSVLSKKFLSNHFYCHNCDKR